MNRSIPGLPCPSPTPGAYSDSCPLSRWCHPTISSSVIPFSSCPQYFPASGSFPVSRFFALGGQSIGALASASVLPMNMQDWSPLGWTGWIKLKYIIILESTSCFQIFSLAAGFLNSLTQWEHHFLLKKNNLINSLCVCVHVGIHAGKN